MQVLSAGNTNINTFSIVHSVPNGGRCYLSSVLFHGTVSRKYVKNMQILSKVKMRAEFRKGWGGGGRGGRW